MGFRLRGNDQRWLTPILGTIALLAVAVPALLVHYGPTVRPAPHLRALPAKHRVVPPAEVPPVEPVAFVQLPSDEARAYNASIPFVSGPIVPARPYRFAGLDPDRARATDCLATALLYEAGDDTDAQRAVAQVVLNRLRHPAYPKTVCGVVFEGHERSTGCQFSFTCDGALARWSPTPAAWGRAQYVAAAALNGTVDRRVGWATHYHTSYVVPYWQSSLDKIAAVGPHLFFRWTGYWGTPAAFRNPGIRPEPAMAELAKLSDAHRTATDLVGEDGAPLDVGLAITPGGIAPVAGDPNSFLVTLPRNTAAPLYPQLAVAACGDRPTCKYSAWTDVARTPKALPLAPEQIATMSFAYLRDRSAGVEKALWNCRETPRPDRTQCMKQQVVAPAPLASPTPSVVAPRGPDELNGIRRRGVVMPPAALTPPGTSPPVTPSPRPPRPRSDAAAPHTVATAAPRRSEP